VTGSGGVVNQGDGNGGSFFFFWLGLALKGKRTTLGIFFTAFLISNYIMLTNAFQSFLI